MKLFSKELTRKQVIVLVGLTLLLLLPNVALIFQFYGLLTGFSLFFMALAILCLPMLVLPLRWAFLVHGVFLLLLPLDVASWVGMHQPITEGFVNSIWFTNRAELSELLPQFIKPLLFFVVCLLLYFYLVLRVLPAGVRFAQKVRLKVLLPLVLLGFFLFSPFGNEELRPFACEQTYSFHQYHLALKWTFNHVFPFDIIRRSFALKRHIDKLHKMKSDRYLEFKIGDVGYNPQDSLIGVFVIGETSRACNWQLAGYERKTNPRLARRRNLYFFDDVFTGANYTRYAVPMLLSTASPDDMYRWRNSPMLTELLAQTTYKRGWISNQNIGEHLLVPSSLDCDYKRELKWELQDVYDEMLLPYVSEFLDVVTIPQMLFVHTLGGHYAYTERYTKAFAQFQPDLANFKAEEGEDPYWVIRLGGKDVPGFVNSFDNTILYTDMVLDSVISFVEAKHKPAFVIYVADHGENLLEPPEYRAYHSYDTPSHYEAHVPYFIWLSDEYLARYPQADSLLRAHLHLPVQSTVTFHTLLDLTRVRYALYDSTQSLLSPHFTPLATRPIINPDGKLKPEPTYPAEGGVCPVYNRRQRK